MAASIGTSGAKSRSAFDGHAKQIRVFDPEIRDYARESFAPSRPVLASAVELMQRIKDDFAYEPAPPQ